ncbi:CFDP2 protein, partial [Acromyrmex heyeri]
MGDFNAKIGRTVTDIHIRNTVGASGVGERNERGERLIQFCINNGLTIANNMFRYHICRLCT